MFRPSLGQVPESSTILMMSHTLTNRWFFHPSGRAQDIVYIICISAFKENTSIRKMEFTTTKRGQPSLICNGYRYTRKRENRSGEVLWCCVARPCGGKVITNNSELIKEESHECVPDEASIDVHKAMSVSYTHLDVYKRQDLNNPL